MSVSQYASRYSNHLDVCRFVLDMRIHGISFTSRDGGAHRLIGAGSWARRWVH